MTGMTGMIVGRAADTDHRRNDRGEETAVPCKKTDSAAVDLTKDPVSP
jgi:hypothetical protein